MAKRPLQKTGKFKRFTQNDLTAALAQLTLVNEACDRVLPILWDAIMAKVVEPAMTTYNFAINTITYQATLSAYQWGMISAAITREEEVLTVVLDLLSNLTADLSATACSMVDAIEGQPIKPYKSNTQSPLGCCTFDGQQKPLTQLQCSQYTMSSWNASDPDCTGKPDPKGR